MNVEPKIIETYKECLSNPKKNNLKFIPIQEYFVVSNKIISKQLLAESYMKHIETYYKITETILFILMHDFFGIPDGKDEHGNLGYFLQPLNEKQIRQK